MRARLVLVVLAAAACNDVFGLDDPTLRATLAGPEPTCANGWTHHIPVTIENPGDRKLSDHQVEIVLDTGTPILEGRMRPDGKDLVLTLEDGSLLNFLVEKHLGTTGTVLWTRIPSIPARATTVVHVHHGHPEPSTMDFAFDVFEEGIIENASFANAGGWTITPPPPETSRYVISWPGSISELYMELQQDVWATVPIRMSVAQDVVFPAGSDHVVRFDLRIVAATQGELGGRFGFYAGAATNVLWQLTPIHGNITGHHVGLETIPIAPGATPLEFRVSIGSPVGGYAIGRLDNLRVRKHVSPAPVVTVGASQPSCP